MNWKSACAGLALMTASQAGIEVDLNGAKGNVHNVDLKAQSFELLKETEYDPKTDLSQSRFTVHWDEASRVVEMKELESFDGIQNPVMALFQGIRESDSRAMDAGKLFEMRVVTLFSDPKLTSGIEPESHQVLGMFTPDARQPRAGSIRIGDKHVPIRLRDKHWRIWHCQLHPPVVLEEGFWKAELKGVNEDGKFVASQVTISKLPDPRETDDPKLPRVLVIGDSISMNYHEAAKQALKGVANYHRCEGNAFSSAHGVRNSELWMGEFKEPGFQWDVIQFNHGLHDLKQAYDKQTNAFGAYAVQLKDYKANLENQIAILRKSGARLIFATTTPVPNDNKGTYARRKGAAKEFNAAALEVMSKHPDILINDLHGMIDGSPAFDHWRTTRDVHFYKPEEQQALGKAVAAAVRKALKK
ncbi:MAG: SGNH/GDSL hydrolase family protein [Luteolibacter sp.]